MLSEHLIKRSQQSSCQQGLKGIPLCKTDYIWIAVIIVGTIILLVGLERFVRVLQHSKMPSSTRVPRFPFVHCIRGRKKPAKLRLKIDQSGRRGSSCFSSAADVPDPWLFQPRSFDDSLLLEQGEIKEVEKPPVAFIYRDTRSWLPSPNDKRLSISNVENSVAFGSPRFSSTPPRSKRSSYAELPPLDFSAPAFLVDPPGYPGSAVVTDKYSANAGSSL